jgi:UDP-N-acetylmuramate: L-alanyl-gamma-D-glutamyl-meso-diaminopimelate ligase
VLITEIFNLNKVDKKMRLNVKKLILDTKKLSKVNNSIYAKDPTDLLLKLKKEFALYSKEKICILAMSNGAFGGIYPKLISMVSER